MSGNPTGRVCSLASSFNKPFVLLGYSIKTGGDCPHQHYAARGIGVVRSLASACADTGADLVWQSFIVCVVVPRWSWSVPRPSCSRCCSWTWRQGRSCSRTLGVRSWPAGTARTPATTSRRLVSLRFVSVSIGNRLGLLYVLWKGPWNDFYPWVNYNMYSDASNPLRIVRKNRFLKLVALRFTTEVRLCGGGL